MKGVTIFLFLVAAGLLAFIVGGVYAGFVSVNTEKIRNTLLPHTKTFRDELIEWNLMAGDTEVPCQSIKDTYSRDNCYASHAFGVALNNSNEAVEACENITKYYTRWKCIQRVGRITGLKPSWCETQTDPVERNTCLRNSAIEAAENDSVEAGRLCDLIENPLRRDWCYLETAEKIIDRERARAGVFCSRIFGEKQKTECYTSVAEALARELDYEGGIEYCEQIPTEDEKQYCREKMAYYANISVKT